MTIEETKQAMKVMQAYIDGKDIQYKLKTSTKWNDIVEYSVSNWNWKKFDYRIKPEVKIEIPVTKEELEYMKITWMKHKESGKLASSKQPEAWTDRFYIFNPTTKHWEDLE